MATFREAREALLLANDQDLIDDEEMLVLYDLNRSRNLDIPYWKYEKFELDSLSDDECKSVFRFLKHDIYTLLDALSLLYACFGNLFSCLNRPWLSQAYVVDFSQSIYRKGAAVDNCWGFIDGICATSC